MGEQEGGAGDAPGPVRKIIHVDMDAFYASVEQRDDPSLRGRPVAVGGSRERGVVAAASYEARRYGVRSAMPAAQARRLCRDLVFVPARFDVYRAVSEEIRAVFERHTPVIEPVALDEAYLDVTENLTGLPTATAVAKAIRAEILERTGLVASAGVSYNKFLAKVASDHRKPDALFVITPAMGPGFAAALPIGRFHGVGPVTEAKMAGLGIRTGADLLSWGETRLRETFGSAGAYYHAAAGGIDERPVRAHRIRKSIGAETTFERDVARLDELEAELGRRAEKVWASALAKEARGRTVTLKLRYDDFSELSRSRTGGLVGSCEDLVRAGKELLRALAPLPRPVRLIGIALSGLAGDEEPEDGPQLRLAL